MRDRTLIGPWIRRFLLEHLVSDRNLINYLEHGAVLPDPNVAQFGPHHVPAAEA
jgi:hypothetical protein